MKKFLRLLSLALVLASPFILSMCKDEPDKPTITALAPATGKEGDEVVISGTFLGSTETILFGTTPAAVIDPQGGQVTTQVPAGLALGSVSVSVSNKGGASNLLPFIVIPPVPEIQAITPDKGASGMDIVLAGKYFATAKSVAFGSTAVTTLSSKTDNAVTVKIPAALALGAVNVTITTDGGTSDVAAFTIVGTPMLTSFSPIAGPAGTHITLTGVNFAETTGVFFKDLTASFTVTNETTIDAVVPAGAATGKIKVVAAGGESLSANDFLVKGAPVVTSFTPSSGPIGTQITITGQNLNLAGVKIKIGNLLADDITIGSDVELKAKIPTGAATGKITVETAAGTGTSATDFSVVGAPTITSFTPPNGNAGTSVTINGTNFINVSSVKFNTAESGAGNFTVNSATKITAIVPVGATNGVISVTTPSGTGISGANFSVNPVPTITSFTPGSGIAGAAVTITGTFFTGTTSVKLNGTTANFTINSATQISTTVPAGGTTGKFTVTNAGGTATSTNNFTVTQLPFISSITPTTGQTGITLTITGTALSAAKVKFNSTEVTTLLANTDTQIQVVVPASLPVSTVNVTVVTASGTSNAKTFNVTPHIDPPIINDLKPAISYKGFPIMIRGSKLKDATSVLLGATAATIVTKYDASMIITIPASIANGTYSVTVVNGGGPSNAVSLNIITAPSGVGAPPGANFVAAPPANYVSVISNFWGPFLLTTTGGDPNCPVTDINDATLCGHITLVKDGSGNVISNYIELTRGAGATLETLYGQYSATDAYPCTQKMTLISGKDGHLVYGSVQVGDFAAGYPPTGCTGN